MVLLNKSHLSTTDCCNSISSNERLFLQIHSSFSQHTLERHKYVLPICLVINLTGLFKKEQEPLTFNPGVSSDTPGFSFETQQCI